MAVRRASNARTRSGNARRSTAAKPAPRKAATPAQKTGYTKKRDVTEYATKPPTPYHKAFARWIVEEVGFDPNSVSPRAAFLRGVSIATAARAVFNQSDFVEEWREKTGETKRGPKPRATEETPARKRKSAPVEEEWEDEDAEDESDEEFEDDESDEEDDDFEDDDESDDESDEDDSEEDDDDWDDEEPAPKRRAPAKATNSRSRSSAPARKAAPAKATRSKAKPASDDDDFVF